MSHKRHTGTMRLRSLCAEKCDLSVHQNDPLAHKSAFHMAKMLGCVLA